MRCIGGIRNEDAGMSNESGVKNLHRRKSKDSYATLNGVGLVGPKERPQGVSNGQQVNIPVPAV